MIKIIDIVKENGGVFAVILLGFWITALVALQLLASAVTGFPKLESEPEIVFTEDIPQRVLDENGCTVISDVTVCPEFRGE